MLVGGHVRFSSTILFGNPALEIDFLHGSRYLTIFVKGNILGLQRLPLLFNNQTLIYTIHFLHFLIEFLDSAIVFKLPFKIDGCQVGIHGCNVSNS